MMWRMWTTMCAIGCKFEVIRREVGLFRTSFRFLSRELTRNAPRCPRSSQLEKSWIRLSYDSVGPAFCTGTLHVALCIQMPDNEQISPTVTRVPPVLCDPRWPVAIKTAIKLDRHSKIIKI